MTLKDLMDKVTSLPKLVEALREGHATTLRIRKLNEAAESELKKLEGITVEISQFFGAHEVGEAIATISNMAIPNLIRHEALPAIPPTKNYEKVIAIIKAADNQKEGITFKEILEVWKSLQWPDWDDEKKLGQKIRDAIKTARELPGCNIQHSGGHGGKFTVK